MIRILKQMIYRKKASERTSNQVDPKTMDLAMVYIGTVYICMNTDMKCNIKCNRN